MKETMITTDKNVLYLEREFDAPVADVWRAWTDAEILEQWWAPLPYKAVTKSMSFTEGGKWHYYMLGPEGQKHWCIVKYIKITPQKNYTAEDAFGDEDGNINDQLPHGQWSNTFSATPTGSKVNIKLTYATEEDLQRITAMGMKEGITMTLAQLDELLKAK